MAFFRTLPGKLIVVAAITGALFYLDLYVGSLLSRRAMDPYVFRILMLIGLSAILAVSLNLVNGVTGQFSIGHAGFMALGAYAAAALTVYGQHRFFPPLRTAAPALQDRKSVV